MTEETRRELALVELVDPPMTPYCNPFPPKGKAYDYKFVKEVITHFICCYNFHMALHLSYTVMPSKLEIVFLYKFV